MENVDISLYNEEDHGGFWESTQALEQVSSKGDGSRIAFNMAVWIPEILGIFMWLSDLPNLGLGIYS